MSADCPALTAPDLQAACRDYLAHLRQKNLADNTIEAYQNDLTAFFRFLTPHLGKKPTVSDLQSLHTRDFRGFLAEKKQSGSSNTSLARHVSVLKGFFLWLTIHHGIDNTAIDALAAPKKPKKIPRPAATHDIAKILQTARTPQKDSPHWQALRDHALFMLLYGAGLRIAEALALDAGMVTHATDSLRVTGKGGKPRIVPLLPIVKQALTQLIDACPHIIDESSALFCGVKGNRLSPRIAQLRLAHIRKSLQLPENLTPHALRHSFASHLLNKGANLREIQELLGHQSIAATQIYTKIENDDMIRDYHHAHPRT